MEGTGGTIPGKVGYHAVLQSRMLKDGKLNCYWVTTNNNMQAGPNINDEMYPGWRNPANFVVVSGGLPNSIGDGCRPDPAGGNVDRKGRRVR